MAMTYFASLLVSIICSAWFFRAEGQNFSVGMGNFNSDNMMLHGGANITENGSLTLIPKDNPAQTAGLAYYRRPVRMLDYASRKTASFSVWFHSYQVPESWTPGINVSTNMRGDGMTFCFSSDRNYESGWIASRLGFFPQDLTKLDPGLKLFAIEYDTFQNQAWEDPPGNHVGIDVGSPKSVKAADVDVSFWEGLHVDLYSWIDYDGVSKVLEVRVANNNSRPAVAGVSHVIDLFNVTEDEMWVGFSAGTGDAYSFYFIEEWKFSNWGLPPKQDSGSSNNLGLIIGCALGGVLLLTVAGLGSFIFIKGRRGAYETTDDGTLRNMVGMPDYYSYKQLSVATKAFSESSKLGQGGFGSVYKGVLPSNGSAVAVKKVSADSKQGEREFLAEVSIISQLRHRNVVQLLGWCRDRGKYLLVYELMPNGSLDKALFHPPSPKSVLNWEQRRRILVGVASALHYLHEGWLQQVIHRDVKSSNIMLDDEFNAKLGDFGLARLVDHSKNAATTLVAGTYGFIAPEAAGSGKFTDKTDVYAFGAVALEIATGRKAFDATATEGEFFLVDMVWTRLSAGQLITVVDRRLEGKYDIAQMEVMLMLGLICSHPDPNSRPSMRQVVQVLAGDSPVPPVPAEKPSLSFSSSYAVTIQDLHQRRTSENNLSEPSSVATTSTYSPSSFSMSTSSTGLTKP